MTPKIPDPLEVENLGLRNEVSLLRSIIADLKVELFEAQLTSGWVCPDPSAHEEDPEDDIPPEGIDLGGGVMKIVRKTDTEEY